MDHQPIGVTALRAIGYSADGESLIISVIVKYSRAERRYSVPISCFEDLVVDLRRLNATKESAPIEARSEIEAHDQVESHGQTASALDAAE